jgi:hypothetical protein
LTNNIDKNFKGKSNPMDNHLNTEMFRKVLTYVVTNHMVDLRLADEGFKFMEQYEKACSNPTLKISVFYQNVYDFLNQGNCSHEDCQGADGDKEHDCQGADD